AGVAHAHTCATPADPCRQENSHESRDRIPHHVVRRHRDRRRVHPARYRRLRRHRRSRTRQAGRAEARRLRPARAAAPRRQAGVRAAGRRGAGVMTTQPLRAFHGDQAIKDKYLARIRAHAAADAITQGIGWENGKGCAIGCTLEAYDHSRYPIELGLPEWLARLEDRIFEGLPKAEAMAWPEAFLEAITPGANLEPVRPKLALRRIDRLIALQNGNAGKHGAAIDAVIAQTVAALTQVRQCHEAEIGGDTCVITAAWSAARSAAWSAWLAAWSARSAAWSAAWKQEAAESAAWSPAAAEAVSAARCAGGESAESVT